MMAPNSALKSQMRRDGIGIRLPAHHEHFCVIRTSACTHSGEKYIPASVNVCEGFENEQGGFWCVFPSEERLQSFYDCDCFKGNSPKTFSPHLFVEESPTIRDRELADVCGFFFPRRTSLQIK